MAARAAFRVGLMIGNILVTGHTVCAACAYPRVVNLVASRAFRMALALRDVCDSVKPRQLSHFVTGVALGLRRDRAAMRLVTSRAVPVSCRALRELLVVAGAACDDPSGFMGRPLVARFAAGMAQIPASQTNLQRVTSPAHRPFAEPAQVKSVGLVASRARKLACVKRSLRRGFLVAVRASSGNP